MAEFAGFTNEQVFKLAQMKGYTGDNNPNSVNKFIMGNDQARSYVMDMYNEATTLVGRQRRGFAPGGLTDAQINAMTPEEADAMVDQLGGANVKWDGSNHGDYSNLDSFKTYSGWENVPGGFDTWKKVAEKAGLGQQNVASSNKNISSGALEYDTNVFQYTDNMAQGKFTPTASTANTDTTTNTGSTTTTASPQNTTNYAELATTTPVSKITVNEGDKTLVGDGTGQITGTPDNIDIGDIDATQKVSETTDLTASQIKDEDIAKTSDTIDENLKDVAAEQGTVSDKAQVDAAQMDSDDLAQLDLKAAQIDEAQKVGDVGERTIQDGELVQSAYDQEKAEDIIKKTEAAYAESSPSVKATVKGQLDELMSDFEPGRTPPWAAGAMRTALAAMNARGLSASSMAGQAIVQAAMESALPIAKADAKTTADFELQNLSNRQEATILAAKQRADFLKIDFDQEFQARVKNASTISEISKQNYDTKVQVALENARMANSVDIANLNAENAKVLSDAAALTTLDVANLNNRQAAQVANAKAFLDMDIANLNAKQQTNILKAQAKVDALFKDQAAENAANQLNIQEKNKVDIAMENIQATQARFNAEQENAMAQVQFQEDAALTKFFASLKENRAQFNANNSLAVSTANAQWYQSVTNFNNGATNQANMNDANNATAMTKMQLEQDYQAARDLMNWVFTADQNDQQRAASIIIAQMDADAKAAEGSSSLFQTIIGAIANL